MKVTFNGVVIALGRDFNGFDAVTGFLPQGRQKLQIEPLTREQEVFIAARGNAQNTVVGRIVPAPAASLGDALLARGALFASLLQVVAPLILQTEESYLTFGRAALETFTLLEDVTEGTSYGYELTFQCGLGTPSQDNAVTDENSAPITDQNNNPITDS